MEKIAKEVSSAREDDPGGSVSLSSGRSLGRGKDPAKNTKQGCPWDRRKVRKEGNVLEARSSETVVSCFERCLR